MVRFDISDFEFEIPCTYLFPKDTLKLISDPPRSRMPLALGN